MDLKHSERYFHGYILVPYCPEDYCHNQLQGLQAIPSSYTGSNLKYHTVLPQQNEKHAHASRNTSQERECDCAYCVVFPAVHRQRAAVCGFSRHKIGEERLFASSLLKGNTVIFFFRLAKDRTQRRFSGKHFFEYCAALLAYVYTFKSAAKINSKGFDPIFIIDLNAFYITFYETGCLNVY